MQKQPDLVWGMIASMWIGNLMLVIINLPLVGYWLIKHDFEPTPMLLGMVLGPLMEENLRRALLISRGDWSVFVTRPLSAVLPTLRKKRDAVFVE